jgi:hypothetical protein
MVIFIHYCVLVRRNSLTLNKSKMTKHCYGTSNSLNTKAKVCKKKCFKCDKLLVCCVVCGLLDLSLFSNVLDIFVKNSIDYDILADRVKKIIEKKRDN